MKRMTLALALLGSWASAQLMYPSSSTLSHPLFKEFTASEKGTYTKDGEQLTFTEKKGWVTKIVISTKSNDVALLAKYTAALTVRNDLEQPALKFLKDPETFKTSTSPTVNVDGGALTYTKNKEGYTLTYEVVEVPVSTFVATKNAVGAAKPKVTIRVFSDFECPYCLQLEQNMLKNYKTKLPAGVRLEFHHFPLTQIHPNALPAALASECAAEQGRFWKYHDLLFADRSWVGNKNATSTVFLDFAKQLRLNTTQFKTCLDSKKFSSVVQTQLNEGIKAGVNGTPSVFVGGYKINNPYDVNLLNKFIEFVSQ